MQYTLAFDVYGTLINTSGVFDTLKRMIGNDAEAFMHTWRNKQLEYSFRRGLMDLHVDFSICTAEALHYTCRKLDTQLSTVQREALMEEYKRLPAFSEVKAGLQKFREQGHRIYAFSNGSAKAVQGLLEQARIDSLFHGVVSVEGVKMFKPSPVVYQHFNEQTKSQKEDSWLISGNPFDVMGAINYGMRAAWIKRNSSSIFDPWDIIPTLTASSLLDLEFPEGK